MKDSEILHSFDEQRAEFKPYGLTCELWKPELMGRPDRHNEIEINFFPEGNITYLFQERRVTVPEKRLAIFWGLIPHQIVDFEGSSPYYVCTIPFSLFLEWSLPSHFVDNILSGQAVVESSAAYSEYDSFLMRQWLDDMGSGEGERVTLLEMRARLSRLAHQAVPAEKDSAGTAAVQSGEVSHVERIAIYIGQNYSKPIEASDIGEAVGLHPDYANTIFRRAFGSTISEYIIEERISHAQRKLITSDANISSIAYECGFNSISWFNSSFKKIAGCTPRAFREANKN